MNRLVATATLGIAAFLLTGCPDAPSDVVQKYTDHMTNEEYGEAFDLLARSAQEEESPAGDFKSAVEIEKIGLDGDVDDEAIAERLKEEESWITGKTWKEVLEMDARAYYIAKHSADGEERGDKAEKPEFEISDEKINGDKATVKLTVKVGEEKLDMDVELVKEDGNWRLASG